MPTTARHAAIFFLLAIALVGLGGRPASAHRSYAVAQAELAFGDGRTATLELLYGDGIFFADPVRAQLRTSDGATIAKTPMAGHIFTFCPSVGFCWVFLSELMPIPWRLLPEQIAWNNPPEANPYFPELDKTPPVGFAADWTPWVIVLGFVVLIFRHALGLASTLLPLALIAVFTKWLQVREHPQVGRATYRIALSVLLWLVLVPYEFVALYYMVVLSGFPLLVLILALTCSLMGANKLAVWLVHRKPSPSKPASSAA